MGIVRKRLGFVMTLSMLAAAFVVVAPMAASRAVAAGPCDPPIVNQVACENTKAGAPSSQWDVSGSGSSAIQGFTTDISANRGGTVQFKVDTTASSFQIDLYRMGYYGGSGARLVATIPSTSTVARNQPNCLSDSATGLVDCGNWSVSASWTVPSDAVSGIYLGKLSRTDGTSGSSHVSFVVRDDSSHSDLLFQTSDTTWQAYNQYGGNSLYTGSPAGRAYKVSYNRPFTTRGTGAEDWVFNAEYPMVRWLEANGYDVSYATGVDSDRLGSLIRQHKVFMSVGHDEYWSGGQRANVEAARDAGVNLAFFSGNESFWKTRWESSIDGSGTSYRTLVSYKETHANAKIDPLPNVWTGTWRDPRFSPPADGGRPENAMTGTSFRVNCCVTQMSASGAYRNLRFWRGTRVASLAATGSTQLGTDTLGYEWDEDPDNGFRPAGLVPLSSTTVGGMQVLLDYGSNYGSGSATHSLTLYRATSGALVFGAGTVQWSWGLDGNHDMGSSTPDTAMQQATVNLFADMGAQPATIRSGLTPATASTDTTAPTSTITSPTSGSVVPASSTVTVSGTASDVGGVVGAVEVSTDGGTTWHRATGSSTWSYSWRTPSSGTATIKTRAADDSGLVENPGAGTSISVGSGGTVTCPCTLWPSSVVPAKPSETTDSSAVELGTKFRADRDGNVTAIRFYKGSTNTGTHVAHLWTSTGTLLATATYTSETASGWQQVSLPSPVPVTANTTYVASYHAPNGQYASDEGYFSADYTNGPLTAPAAGNGVYSYGSPGVFPASSFSATNYYVDPVFTTSASLPTDTTPPTLTSRTPANQATGVSTSTNITSVFSEPVVATSISVTLRDGVGTNVGTAQSYDGTTNTATFSPSAALSAGTTYTVTVSGAKDIAGNTMVPDSWTFTTAVSQPPDTTPPTITSRTPAAGATNVVVSTKVSAVMSEPVVDTTISVAVKNAAGTAVSGSQSYAAATRTVTFAPTASLSPGATYTVTVSGARDTAGNTMADDTWTFATTPAPTCPCSLFTPTAAPRVPASTDKKAVELGVRFRADTNGFIRGIRFYKGAGNTGTHLGRLWTNSGTRLASATFTGETATGWQQVMFASPVAITAGTTYVASYYAPVGRYADDEGFFTTGVDNGPLHAPASVTGSPNGIYRYGANGGFPSTTYLSTNYWVDVVFAPTAS